MSKEALENRNYTIKSRKEKELDNLVGDEELYIDHPPKVDYYEVFYFETRARDMINEFIEPWR